MADEQNKHQPSKGRMPDFIIIGAAKSGTTTLYQYLCRHPNIYMPKRKEPGFFVEEDVFKLGLGWYQGLFADARRDQLCGEASTNYTRYPQYPNATTRIAEFLPKVKLIYIMRQPVERAYSHYVQEVKNDQRQKQKARVDETFEQHIERDTTVIDSSNYMLQIRQYLEFFGKESFLFLLMEDLSKKPAEVCKQTCSFLGIDDSIDLVEGKPIAANLAKTHESEFLRKQIMRPIRAIPGISKLWNPVPKAWRDKIYSFIESSPYGSTVKGRVVPKPMSDATRAMLTERFSPMVDGLSVFLDRDLSCWRK